MEKLKCKGGYDTAVRKDIALDSARTEGSGDNTWRPGYNMYNRGQCGENAQGKVRHQEKSRTGNFTKERQARCGCGPPDASSAKVVCLVMYAELATSNQRFKMVINLH